MSKKCCKLVSGTALAVGDVFCWAVGDHNPIAAIVSGQHDLGAKYSDITLNDGRTIRTWEGFNYHIEVEQELV